MIDCGMCGHSFTFGEGTACSSGCPMSSGCGMVTCPSCGYEFPRESKLLTVLTNLVRRRVGHRATEAPLRGELRSEAK